MKAKIDTIESVKLTVSGVAKIKVTAVGQDLADCTDPELKESEQSSSDATASDVVTVHFDFVATKPATQVIELTGVLPGGKIAAETSVPAPGVGKRLRVVVHGGTNEKEDSIESPLDQQ